MRHIIAKNVIPFISALFLDSQHPFCFYGVVNLCKGRTLLWCYCRDGGDSASPPLSLPHCRGVRSSTRVGKLMKKWDALCFYSQDVGDDSNGPAVHGFAVWFLGEDFRGCKKAERNENYKQQ